MSKRNRRTPQLRAELTFDVLMNSSAKCKTGSLMWILEKEARERSFSNSLRVRLNPNGGDVVDFLLAEVLTGRLVFPTESQSRQFSRREFSKLVNKRKK